MTDIHPAAFLAAAAARCAGDQGAFWPMHDRLFEGHEANEWARGSDGDRDTMVAYAEELGLDAARFEACITQGQFIEQITAEQQAALRVGITSTPSFLVNGKLLVGAYPYEVWVEVITQELHAVQRP